MYRLYPYGGDQALIAAIQEGHAEVVEFLLQECLTKGVDFDNLYYNLVATDHVSVAHVLTKYKPFPIYCQGQVTLELSLAFNCSAMTRYLLENSRYPLNYRFSPEQIQTLIDRGWDDILQEIITSSSVRIADSPHQDWCRLYCGLLLCGDIKNLNLLLPHFPPGVLEMHSSCVLSWRRTLSTITQQNLWRVLKWLDDHALGYDHEYVFDEACIYVKKDVLNYLLGSRRKHFSPEYQSNKLCDAIRSRRHTLVVHLLNSGIDLFSNNDKAFALANRLGNTFVIREMQQKRTRALERMFATLVCASV